MAFASSVTVTDPLAAIHPQDAIVLQGLNDALNAWSTYIAGAGTLLVNLNFASLGAPSSTSAYLLAQAGPGGYDTSTLGTSRTVTNAAQDVLTSGKQITSSDINVTFNADLLSTVTSENSYSLVTVLTHELFHGLGVSGFRGNYVGPIYGSESSRFDALTVLNGAGEFFTGAAAERIYGGPVPLTTQLPGSDNYHVGATGTPADGSLFSDVIAPYLYAGAKISALDVAILNDLGIPLTAAGQVLEDPNATVTATSASINGASVTDPVISGTTQAGETVTIYGPGGVVGTTTAAANGVWSIRLSGLADGAQYLAATVSTASGVSQAGVPLILDTTTPIVIDFEQILGRDPTAGDLAGERQVLVNGGTAAALRSTIATSAEAAAQVRSIYGSVLGRSDNAAEQTFWQGALAAGSSLSAIRTALAGSQEAAVDVQGAYQSVVGRSATASEVAFYQAAFAAGAPISAVRSNLAFSAEAANAIQATYISVVGRAGTSGELAFYQNAFAAGAPLSAVRANLATSNEAGVGVINGYEAILGRAPTSAAIAFYENAFLAGAPLSSVRANLTTSGEATADISSVYQYELGRAATPGDVAFWQGAYNTGSALSYVHVLLATTAEANTDVANAYQATLNRAPTAADTAFWQGALTAGSSVTAVTPLLANTAEAQADVTASLQAALGHAPDPLQVTGAQSELLSGRTLAQVGAAETVLGGAPPPPLAFAAVIITPETIAGASGTQMVFGLPDNLVVVAAGKLSVSTLTGNSITSEFDSVGGFNPATDLIVIPRSETASYSVLQSHISASGGGTIISPGTGTIALGNIAPTQLSATNFKFV